MNSSPKVNTLIEALPYIRRYHKKTVVIKYGGNAMIAPELKTAFARDVTLLKLAGINPVVVHGGGPQIADHLNRIGKQSRFVDGMRVTDHETMEIVEMVLGGLINKEIVNLIHQNGGKAVGVTGKDGRLIKARRLQINQKSKEIDIGQVGEIESIECEMISALEERGFIPVVAPIGVSDSGETFNINADLVASDLATALEAEVLLMLTNVHGVLKADGEPIAELSAEEAKNLVMRKVIHGGMLPKVEYAIRSVERGVKSCRIIDGTVAHAVLLELLTDQGAGTLVVPS